MRNIQMPSNLISELNIPQIIDITDQLPKRGKLGWDALEDPRDINALTDVAWHHTAEFVEDDISPERHANNHIKAGEGGFPYHFYIKNGQVYQGNDILTFTYGVRSNNYYTVHVAVEGCYCPHEGREGDVLTDDNLRAMIGLELTLREVLPNYQRTNGHNFYQPTACPGFSMTKFRKAVEDVQNKLKFANSEQSLFERSYSIANYILYLYNMSKGKDEAGNDVPKGASIWARERLLLLEGPVNELKK